MGTGPISRARVPALAVLALAALSMTACGSSPTTDEEVAAPSASARPATFGDPREDWEASHEAAPGVDDAFLPEVTTASGATVPTWTDVRYADGDRVVGLTRSFEAGTDQKRALGQVRRQDLPPDAQKKLVVRDLEGCRLIQFSSRELRQAIGQSLIVVSLTSGPDPTPYDPRSVEAAVVGLGTKDLQGSFC